MKTKAGIAASAVTFCIGFTGCMPDDTEIDPATLGVEGSAGSSGGIVPRAGSSAAGAGPLMPAAGSLSTGRGGSGAAGTAAMSGSAGSGAGRGGSSGAAGAAAGRGGAGGMAAGAGGAAAGAGGRGGAGGAAGAAGAGAGGRGGAGGAGGAAGAGAGGAGGAGAGGRGGAGGAGGAAGAGAGGAGGMPAGDVTFTEIYEDLFEMDCNGCHGPGEGGLMTNTVDAAYQNIVNAESESCAGKNRVTPGDANASVLYLAIARTSADGCNPPDMPSGGAKWAQEDIDRLRDWIEAGAKK